jgi:hypothetical protein
MSRFSGSAPWNRRVGKGAKRRAYHQHSAGNGGHAYALPTLRSHPTSLGRQLLFCSFVTV